MRSLSYFFFIIFFSSMKRMLSLLRVHTFAFHIFTPTDIAKLILAPTSHMIASFIFLHPKFAARTLLVFGPFHKDHKLPIRLIKMGYLLKLFTRQIGMHKASTFEAIMTFTGRTTIVCQIFIEGKNSFAAWSRTPCCIQHVFIHIILENKLLIFLSQFFAQEFFDFIIFNLSLTIFRRTKYWKILINNFFFRKTLKAFFMIHMHAFQKTKRVHIDLTQAYRTLCP